MPAADLKVLSQGMATPSHLRKRDRKGKRCSKGWKRGVFHRLGEKGKSVSVHSDDSRRLSHHSSHRDTEICHQSSRSRATKSASERRYNKRVSVRRTEELLKSEGSAGGHWKSKLKRQKSSIEDDLSQPWLAAKTERWAMPTWCHMFNSTLTGNARKKCIKDPVEIHNIMQRDGESTEEFVRRYKLECMNVKGALECMKIFRFMHGIINPELIYRLHDKMMRVTTTFLRGEVAASNRERKKPFSSWKHQEANQKQNFKKGGLRNQQMSKKKQD
ncbi:hypothetical protein Tco_0605361 [Tanacetum coccineum]